MACIIRMTSDELLDKFIKKHDYRKFNFLLISEDVKTLNKYKNVYTIPTLIPPANIISEFITKGYTSKYIKKFLDYIATPRVEAMVTIMVKLATVDNSNVILLCSKAEDEFKYLDIICQYIEYNYDIKTYTYKKYKKNPKECEELSDKEKKRVVKILNKKLEDIKDLQPPKLSEKEVRNKFKKIDKKEAIKLLKTYGIKFNPKDSKKELRKLIINEYLNGRLG